MAAHNMLSGKQQALDKCLLIVIMTLRVATIPKLFCVPEIEQGL